MPRLNNKDYTVEELERLIYLASILAVEVVVKENEVDPIAEEVKELTKGSQYTNFEEGERKPNPIPWSFKFNMLINPESKEMEATILNAMRSAEVNDNISKRFNAIVREEVNWYIDKVKYLMVKGGSDVLE